MGPTSASSGLSSDCALFTDSAAAISDSASKSKLGGASTESTDCGSCCCSELTEEDTAEGHVHWWRYSLIC